MLGDLEGHISLYESFCAQNVHGSEDNLETIAKEHRDMDDRRHGLAKRMVRSN